MIPFIEDEISNVLKAGMKTYKGNIPLISSVLGIGEERANNLSNILSTRPPAIRRGYPRTPTELPCICIMLAGEDETQSGIGDHNDEPLEIVERTETVDVPLRIIDSIPTLVIDKVPLCQVFRVFDPITGEDIRPFMVSDPQRGRVQIFNMSGLSEGKYLSVEFSHRNTIASSIESKYNLNYRVEVWTNNGDFTVELYHMVKAILLQGRGYLIDRGLVKQNLTGTDFQPVPSFFPEFVYRRGVSLQGEALISIPDINNFDSIISDITVKPNYEEQ